MTQRSAQPRILVVDDDAEQTAAIAAVLSAAGYEVEQRADSFEGLIAIEQSPPDLIILDWEMPFITGGIIVEALRAALPSPPPVLVLAGEHTDPAELDGASVRAWLTTPPDGAALAEQVRAILAER